MFGMFLDNRQNARGDNAMRLAKIAVDLLQCQGYLLLQPLELLGQRQGSLRHVEPKSVRAKIVVVGDLVIN
jgi:hypothetical protein